MNTRSLIPPLAISGYVDSMLVVESMENTGDFLLPLYANGSPTIVFHNARASRQNQAIGNFCLYGQTIQPEALSFKENFTLIAYFLHPHSLKALFNISAHELTDGYVDLNDLKLTGVTDLQDQLLNEPLLENRLQLINSFILTLSNRTHTDNGKILFATNELKRNHGVNALTELQGKLNTTERSLQRMFEANVGVSPKMFKRICQFHSAFQQVNQYQFSKLTGIAYENGFSDQSHFIRVFKEFTGLTPKEYLAKRAIYAPEF